MRVKFVLLLCKLLNVKHSYVDGRLHGEANNSLFILKPFVPGIKDPELCNIFRPDYCGGKNIQTQYSWGRSSGIMPSCKRL